MITNMPTIEFDNSPKELSEDKVRAIVLEFCEKLSIDMSGSILEILFLSQDEMRKLNKTTRNIDTPTDVLSFPQTPTPAPRNVYGTIVISPQDAMERNEEIFDLIKHGLLHLAGYDHENDSESWKTAAIEINHLMGI